jgi:hypothetical protein
VEILNKLAMSSRPARDFAKIVPNIFHFDLVPRRYLEINGDQAIFFSDSQRQGDRRIAI